MAPVSSGRRLRDVEAGGQRRSSASLLSWTTDSARSSRRPMHAGVTLINRSSAVAFLFETKSKLTLCGVRPVEEAETAEDREKGPGLGQLSTGTEPASFVTKLQLPPFTLRDGAAALILPVAAVGAAAATTAGMGSGSVSMAMMPIAMPFSVPHVPPEVWMASKRARAFHRASVVAVYVQGGICILKFATGDLIGGTYAALSTLMGLYALQAEGVGFLPTYIFVSAFNGVLGAFQIFQTFQGIPLHALPLLAAVPPVTSILAAYWGWELCKEIKAIGHGNPQGAQDTCFVRFMGGDWWPSSAVELTPTQQQQQQASAGGSTFQAFGGSGHQLGSG